MGKMTFTIDEQIEEDLRNFVAKTYPLESYGKLSKIVNEALKFWLLKYGQE